MNINQKNEEKEEEKVMKLSDLPNVKSGMVYIPSLKKSKIGEKMSLARSATAGNNKWLTIIIIKKPTAFCAVGNIKIPQHKIHTYPHIQSSRKYL